MNRAWTAEILGQLDDGARLEEEPPPRDAHEVIEQLLRCLNQVRWMRAELYCSSDRSRCYVLELPRSRWDYWRAMHAFELDADGVPTVGGAHLDVDGWISHLRASIARGWYRAFAETCRALDQSRCPAVAWDFQIPFVVEPVERRRLIDAHLAGAPEVELKVQRSPRLTTLPSAGEDHSLSGIPIRWHSAIEEGSKARLTAVPSPRPWGTTLISSTRSATAPSEPSSVRPRRPVYPPSTAEQVLSSPSWLERLLGWHLDPEDTCGALVWSGPYVEGAEGVDQVVSDFVHTLSTVSWLWVTDSSSVDRFDLAFVAKHRWDTWQETSPIAPSRDGWALAGKPATVLSCVNRLEGAVGRFAMTREEYVAMDRAPCALSIGGVPVATVSAAERRPVFLAAIAAAGSMPPPVMFRCTPSAPFGVPSDDRAVVLAGLPLRLIAVGAGEPGTDVELTAIPLASDPVAARRWLERHASAHPKAP
ncbi:MAG: hypothetical protein ABMB14_20385 [Myxococcota bacterium]